ncbi:hypothetical protein EDC01DRAFT_647512 [Geopyxis carbonaria]|nr:hypothetical protein EDC01DRAFT_647512 [Geopyxis carbonaria]
MAATAASKAATAAAQQRIINHMNAQHQPDLSAYLQHYARLPPALSRTAHLKAISLSRLTISITNGPAVSEIHIPIDPPLREYSEARERLAAMSVDAKRGLGVVTEWSWNMEGVLVAFGVVAGLVTFAAPEYWLGEGGAVKRYVFMDGCDALVDVLREWGYWIWAAIVACHIIEAVVMHRSRLSRRGVEMGSRLWWAWIVSTLFEGFPAIKRFDRHVKAVQTAEPKRITH